MKNTEKKKERIIKLIDKNERQGPKIAFYSDQEVSILRDELYKRWENSGKTGIPLDYATDEEVEFLYNKAIEYSRISDEEAWSYFIKSENGTVTNTDKVLKRKRSIWKRIFWFILPG